MSKDMVFWEPLPPSPPTSAVSGMSLETFQPIQLRGQRMQHRKGALPWDTQSLSSHWQASAPGWSSQHTLWASVPRPPLFKLPQCCACAQGSPRQFQGWFYHLKLLWLFESTNKWQSTHPPPSEGGGRNAWTSIWEELALWSCTPWFMVRAHLILKREVRGWFQEMTASQRKP